jgi:hypothetical protein
MPTTKKREGRKAKRNPLSGREPWQQLYRAVERYVKSKGGSIVVIGGIQIQEWRGDPKGVYVVAVTVLGRKPTFAEDR